MIGYDSFVAVRFKAKDLNIDQSALALMHAAIGISGEAGEVLDAIKKHWVYGKPLDRANVIEELGDIEFYMQALRAELGVSRDEVIQANREKLLKRYPAGYTDQQAIARADKEPADMLGASERSLTGECPAGNLEDHVAADKEVEALLATSYGGTL